MLWSNKPFQRLFISYTFSTLGDWFDMMAMTVMIGYVWNSDPMILAMVPLTFAVPGLLFGQIAGVLADRWPKLRLLIVMDILSAGLTVALMFAPNVYVLLALLTLRSCAGTFHYPAQQALTRLLVAKEELLKATSLNGIVNQVGKVLGPVLGGTLVAVFSPQACMLVNAVSFALSAMILLTVGRVEERRSSEVQSEAGAEASEPKLSFGQEWKAGWSMVASNRVLLNWLVFGLVASAALQLGDFQIPVVFREYDATRTDLFGYAVSSIGVGSVISIALLSRRKEIKSYGWLFGATGLLRPGMAWWMIIVVALIGGLGNGLTMTGTNYVMQKETPPEAIGRVSGIMNSMFSVVLIVSPLTGGVLVRTFGASPTFQGIGMFLVVMGVVGILVDRVWFQKKRTASTMNATS
ncbi:MFS transporter [Tumebacillus permanentifrigoris]|uniref:Putative MFS family arabinose efflux permease n=1 Tax=Tumebacillus permanentifrigoris TaxID=378543 RepID=A0A316DEE3_9BACL|nr:MFS transporter [Tumebacillus permanentifrigoris]PWK14317.1 putative MFS family arabinose efflux permease [Tumebacillus permanentifrigoris]